MNVVRLVGYFPPYEEIRYGLEPTFYHLSREQVKLGVNVHVISKRFPHQERFEKVEGIYVHRVMAPYNLLMPYELSKINYRTKVDLIHAHATSGFLYALFNELFLLGQRTKIDFIAHVHGTTKGILFAWSKIASHIFDQETMRQRFERHASIMRETVMWKSADALITNSEFLKKELVNFYGIPKENIYVVYNGVDPRTFYPRKSRKALLTALGLNLKSRVILYLGGFRPVKGPVYIINALDKIYAKLENVKVLFVGGSHPLDRYYDKFVWKLVKNFKEKGVIYMIENIPHFQLPDYYSAADAIVVPSTYDSFPKVILEAMACGTPVVASAVGGIPEIISHNETGVLVKPADPDELAEAVIRVISDTNLRQRLRAKARRLVQKRFTWEQVARRTLRIYKKVNLR